LLLKDSKHTLRGGCLQSLSEYIPVMATKDATISAHPNSRPQRRQAKTSRRGSASYHQDDYLLQLQAIQARSLLSPASLLLFRVRNWYNGENATAVWILFDCLNHFVVGGAATGWLRASYAGEM
jgi:hypothetical protein